MIVLLLCVLFVLLFGCRNRVAKINEGFEGKSKEGTIGGLTDSERELFDDLRNDKLSDEQIQKLVEDGTLTENTVGRFLNNLQEEMQKASKKK